MNSEVQTGVKSAGWLKRMTQLPAYCSGKLISPWVVTALKAGALSPMRGIGVDGCCMISIFLPPRSVMIRPRSFIPGFGPAGTVITGKQDPCREKSALRCQSLWRE